MKALACLGRFEPLFLLLACGCCLGSIFPLGKSAQAHGVSALTYTFMTAAGASLVLAVMTRMAGLALLPTRETCRYSAIAGQLTFAIPWGCVVIVLPMLGSALPAIIQSMTPIATLALVYGLRLEKLNPIRFAGILVGLAGIVMVLVTQQHQPATGPAAVGWYALAFITPVALALGNVFRSTNWPATNNHPLQLATWSLLAAAFGVLCVWLLWPNHGVPLTGQLAAGWPYFAVQCVATGVGYASFFRLQLIGGPIYVSQLSYVNTAAGVLFAVTVHSETLSRASCFALAFAFMGILIVSWAQTDQQ